MVIDSRVGHLGGMNLGARFGDWADLALRVEGPAAAELRESHESVWTGRYRKPLFMPWRHHGLLPEIHFLDNFSDEQYSPIKQHYMSAIRHAKTSIRMAHGYFFPDRRLRKELRKAARRGVAVEIVVPASSNIPPVDYAARFVFRQLLGDGVRLFLYRGGMMHAKVAVVDDHWLTLGSANLDPISMFSCLELNATVQHRPLVEHVEAVIAGYQRHSVPVDEAAWARRSRLERAFEWFWFHARKWYARLE